MMKMITAAAALGLVAANAKADIDAFYSGLYLGMPLDDCASFYLDGDPRIADAGYMVWGGAHTHAGQRLMDFRSNITNRRVQIIYRESDRKIVSVAYYDLNNRPFAKEELKELMAINRGRGQRIVSSIGENGTFFEVTTPQQLKLEMTPINFKLESYESSKSPFDTPHISKIDADWARANAARIEVEKKAKAAAGPTKEELESAAHDAEIRASNERALKELNHE
jgi:hypothetical protein